MPVDKDQSKGETISMNKKPMITLLGVTAIIGGLGACDRNDPSSSPSSSSSSSTSEKSEESSESSVIPAPTYKKITMGSYPQSKVSDSTLIASLNEAAGSLPTEDSNASWTPFHFYYGGGDKDPVVKDDKNYFWYQDVTANGKTYRGIYFINNRPTETYFQFDDKYNNEQVKNGYSKETTYWFAFEDITWRVLSESNGEQFVLADQILDAQEFYHAYAKQNEPATTERAPYDSETTAAVYNNNYKYSNIRGWLNQDFYNLAFSESEASKINATTVDNSLASTGYDTSDFVCDNTSDKIFLPSFAELTNSTYQFRDASIADPARVVTVTDYAKCIGAGLYSSNDNARVWMTRTPGSNHTRVSVVNNDGAMINSASGSPTHYRTYTYNTNAGIRPAMKITPAN